MTATTYNSNLLYAGLRELSQVTNTFAGYLISGGSAYTLQTPWQADKLEWFNYTKYGTNTNNVQVARISLGKSLQIVGSSVHKIP